MTEECKQTHINPYEVTRNPPKKKKRLEEESTCFENHALNLDLPEKKLNPYEVIRNPKTTPDTNCFTNAALNLKVQDSSTYPNPFEIQRYYNNNNNNNDDNDDDDDDNKENMSDKISKSVTPCNLRIALPFAPTTQYRIDFGNISLTGLSPSKMLAEKFLFSPGINNPRRSLDVIKEESSADISKELESYQLQLENSINEAKLRKNDGYVGNDVKKVTLNENFIEETNNNKVIHEVVKNDFKIREKNYNDNMEDENSNANGNEIMEIESLANHTLNDSDNSLGANDLSGDIQYGDTAITPCAFVRNYRKADGQFDKIVSNNNNKNADQHSHMKVTTILRKSIRKLLPQSNENVRNNNLQGKCKETKSKLNNKCFKPNDKTPNLNSDPTESKADTITGRSGNSLIQTMRQSLRRRKNPLQSSSAATTSQSSMDISIVDKSERVMSLKTNSSTLEYMQIEELTSERKFSLRGSSRRSSRSVKQHLMKTVFHKKNLEIDFRK